MQLYALVAAAIGWFGLVLQYLLVAQHHSALLTWTINFFSFFTILSNVLAALVLTIAALPGDRSAGFFTRPSVRAAIALYMTVTGLVYFFVLRHLWHPEGWSFVADATLHYLMPLIYLLFWLLFATSGALRAKDAFVWLVFPVVYVVYTLIRGAAIGYYPYPFLDAAKLGYPQVFANIAMLTVGFTAIAFVLVALSRTIAKRRAL
jgi:hypothetical protein